MANVTKKSLEEARRKLEKQAKELGLNDNYLFLSTLKRLDVQVKALSDLEAELAEGETLVEKEYVKGRKNVYLNPAIEGYNKTAQQANNTTQALVKIIKDLGSKPAEEDEEL